MDQHAPSFGTCLYSQGKKLSGSQPAVYSQSARRFRTCRRRKASFGRFSGPSLGSKVGRRVHESCMHLAWHLLDLNITERCWCIAVAHHTPKYVHATYWLHLIGKKNWLSAVNMFVVEKHQQDDKTADHQPRHQYSKLSLTAWWRTGGHSATWKDASLGSSKCKVSGFTQVTWQFSESNITILRGYPATRPLFCPACKRWPSSRRLATKVSTADLGSQKWTNQEAPSDDSCELVNLMWTTLLFGSFKDSQIELENEPEIQ